MSRMVFWRRARRACAPEDRGTEFEEDGGELESGPWHGRGEKLMVEMTS